MFEQIQFLANILCETTNLALERLVYVKIDDLPFYLFFGSTACYVKYDTQDERITDVQIVVMNNNGFTVEVDPIKGSITGNLANQCTASIEMEVYVANTVLACIREAWQWRLSTDRLITVKADDRHIVADLLAW